MRKVLIASILSAAVALLASCWMRAQDNTMDGTGWAVVNVSDAFMREEPRYGSELVSQTRMGTLVRVLEQKGYWVKIQTPEPYEGWVNEVALAPVKTIPSGKQAQLKEYGPKLSPLTEKEGRGWLARDRFICVAEDTFVYEKPSAGATRLSNLKMGCMLASGHGSGSAAGNLPEGWSAATLPDGRTGCVRSADVQPFREWAEDVCWHRISSGEDVSDDIISLAKKFLGMPYLWGGMSVGHFDCSGLTGFCFFMNGILLPRDASQQAKCGIEVPVEKMKKGDLVFFGDSRVAHVALCIGGRRIIHASQVVRINSLDPAAPDYYGRNILHVRRILGHLDDGAMPAVRIIDSPCYF